MRCAYVYSLCVHVVFFFFSLCVYALMILKKEARYRPVILKRHCLYGLLTFHRFINLRLAYLFINIVSCFSFSFIAALSFPNYFYLDFLFIYLFILYFISCFIVLLDDDDDDDDGTWLRHEIAAFQSKIRTHCIPFLSFFFIFQEIHLIWFDSIFFPRSLFKNELNFNQFRAVAIFYHQMLKKISD